MSPRVWTPEQRAELGAKIRAAKAAKAAQALPETSAPNPIANDIVTAPKTRLVSRPKRSDLPPESLPDADSSVAAVLSALESLPLGTISYADCGNLLNALSASSTAIATARRQKQEQLEFGTHKAPCKTCGRIIDISKPGGFQILTERDEHFMPVNRYYCSQNCLLARNMPSHAKQTPREKRENQA